MKRLLTKYKSLYPESILFLLTLLIAITNFKANTYVTGWDNLHPEFYLSMNIKRSIFAVWQEYQSLGLLGGMGHAADLVRQLFLLPLTYILPQEHIRLFWTMLTLLIGSIGAYRLTVTHVVKNNKSISLIAGLFYTLNLATIQMYFVPFEAFIAHFASIPWLLLATFSFIQKRSFKTLIFTSIVLVLTTPQAYIPTLFVASFITIALSITTLIFFKQRKQVVKNAVLLAGLVIVINAFWLLPFTYFTLTKSDVNVNSKINQMATENIFLQNKEFGKIQDTALLKGFWFNNVDVNLDQNFSPMFAPWKSHINQPIISIIGYILFAIIVCGAIKAFISKKPYKIALAVVFLFTFTMITTDTPPFEQLNILFRKIPLFNQAFRFPFTKFSILAALMYSIFLAYGAKAIMQITKNRLTIPIILATITLIGINTYPVFQGNFFYEKEQIKIPQEYFDTFNFFKAQDQNTRIAHFPQHTFWGWNFYSWGYGGSGFLWYGIKQPILDRAFDVWSEESEQYYYEISQAIYSENEEDLKNVLDKYFVDWIVLDTNIIYPIAPGSLDYSKTEEMLKNIPTITLKRKFNNIYIYEVNHPHKNFLAQTDSLPSINNYDWLWKDSAFEENGHYITQNGLDLYYPFRSLHSNRSQDDISFNVQETDEQIVFTQDLLEVESNNFLVADYYTIENTIPTKIVKIDNENNSYDLYLVSETPTIEIDDTKILENKKQNFIATLDNNENAVLDINGLTTINLPLEKENVTTLLSLKEKNIITLSISGTSQTTELTQNDIKPEATTNNYQSDRKFKKLTVKIPKINDNFFNFQVNGNELNFTGCNRFRNGKLQSDTRDNIALLTSQNASLCADSHSPNLPHDTGYIAFTQAENKTGRSLHFWILNENQDIAPIDTYLPKNKTISTHIVPPMDVFGKSYSFHYDNISIGNEISENVLKTTAVFPIPYNYLKSLKIGKTASGSTLQPVKISTHPNESLYTLKLEKNQIILGQAFDSGWKAYTINGEIGLKEALFPFLFGSSVDSHVLVDGWANGWIFDKKESTSNTVIVYVPQYLQYAGFLTLLIFSSIIIFFSIKHHKNYKKQ